MGLGDLVVKTILVELVPVQQACVCSDHEHVGSAFHLVQGCMCTIVINMFREGAASQGTTPNPISTAHHLTFIPEDGTPLKLTVERVPVDHSKATLPQCLSFAAVWAPVKHRSATLLNPTEWPDTRKLVVDMSVELKHLPNQPQVVSTELHFQVHKKESVGMKSMRAKDWAKEEYLKLKPSTRAAISGSLTVVKLAGKALLK